MDSERSYKEVGNTIPTGLVDRHREIEVRISFEVISGLNQGEFKLTSCVPQFQVAKHAEVMLTHVEIELKHACLTRTYA